MLSFDATQLAIVASDIKVVSWLFTVIDSTGPTTYRWSTKAIAYGGNTYSFKVIASSFNGITLNGNKSQLGLQAPNKLSFTVTNSGEALTARNFIDGSVQVDLVMNDFTNADTVIRTLKFNIKKCEPVYQTLKFTCEDFIQKYLQGDYPNEPLVQDLFYSDDAKIGDDICVPVPFGTCFIPLPSIYVSPNRYYLIGLASKTFTIDKVRSPRQMGYRHDWSSVSYAFTQSSVSGSDGGSYKCFTAIIAGTSGGVSANAHGLFIEGNQIFNLPTKFSREDTEMINGSSTGLHTGAADAAVLSASSNPWTASSIVGAYSVNRTDNSYGRITDNSVGAVTATLAGGTDNDWDANDAYTIGGPASIIRFVLIDMGVSASDIDDPSFGATELKFAKTFTLVWNGAFWKKQPRNKTLAFLLNQCHASLVVRDKIYLKILSKTSQKTITGADVVRPSEIGQGTFSTQLLDKKRSDSGYMEYQPADEIQDEFQKVLVSAKFASGTHSGVSNIAFLEDSTQSWPVNSLIGGVEKNLTDGSEATITANSGITVTGTLAGGTGNDWDYGDSYEIKVTQNIEEHTLPCHFIQDSQDAQRAGMLYFERKFLGSSRRSFVGKGTLLALEPDDVITINKTDYGGNYQALIESIHINRDVSIKITADRFDEG